MTTTAHTQTRTTVKADLKTRADLKAANPKAKNLDKIKAGSTLKSGSTQKPGAATAAHRAAVKDAVKASGNAKAAAPATPKVDPAIAAAAKAVLKAEQKAAFEARIAAQKIATAAKHHAQKLFSSFTARVKYMAYMDNPEFGGLDGRESIGWTLTHVNSTGVHLKAERKGDTVYFYTGKEQIGAIPCTREDVASLLDVSKWAA